MRTSRFPLHTLREAPSDAEVVSHQLMFRAGLIRKLAAGIYTWLPLGWRVLKKVENIIREEMDRAGALEILMPALQPAELWHESGRWEKYGPELVRLKDRHERDVCLGPTHEEVMTDLIRHEIKSYKQLPVNYYQIQTKFRDEIRPRFGVMRAREFIMKDAYSFHRDEACLQKTYELMKETYCRIFSRMGLDFRVVLAPTGAIGGHLSHEFHVLAETGEAQIVFSTESDYAANIELAEAAPTEGPRPEPKEPLRKVSTPGQRTIEAVASFLQVPVERCLKTLIVKGKDGGIVALFLRGDHELNPLKAERLPEVQVPLEFATDEEIEEVIGCPPGYLGPVGLEGVPMVVDRDAAWMSDFVCGANEEGYHYTGANWERDVPLPKVADLRFVKEGDPSPDGRGTLVIKRGIEVGHIFQLGTRYSEALNATALDEEGREFYLIMGCYGIGVSRVVAAAIEQNHDERGIIWPEPIAPFKVAIVPIGYHRSERVREAAERLYQVLTERGVEVLLDDRDTRPGVMFNDMDLIGIPHRVVVSDRLVDRNLYEYRHRRTGATENLPFEALVKKLA